MACLDVIPGVTGFGVSCHLSNFHVLNILYNFYIVQVISYVSIHLFWCTFLDGNARMQKKKKKKKKKKKLTRSTK